MKFFKKSHDGGADSGVTGYWIIEWKSLFSIVILKFNKGTRDAYHSHAFNALTWWIKGSVIEYIIDPSNVEDKSKNENRGKIEPKSCKRWDASFIPKFTPRNCFHKIYALEPTIAISFRGRWSKTWKEHKNNETYELTHGRKRVN